VHPAGEKRTRKREGDEIIDDFDFRVLKKKHLCAFDFGKKLVSTCRKSLPIGGGINVA
jgi:hypothetical protein